MVAADCKNGHLHRGKAYEKVIPQFHCLFRRNGFVVDIARDKNAVWLFLRDNRKDLPQNVFLIRDHGELVQLLSEVKIRYVKQFHFFLNNAVFLRQ